MTDEAGRFELPAGAAKALAVSYPGFDAWPAPIPAEAQVVVRLPKPARVDVEFNIEGAPREGTLFYQLLSHLTPEFAGLQSSRTLPIANGESLVLAGPTAGQIPDLSPGDESARRRRHRRHGRPRVLRDQSGGNQVHPLGPRESARLRGKVILPKDVKLSGILVSVMSEKAERDPFEKHEWPTTHASQTTAGGRFLRHRANRERPLPSRGQRLYAPHGQACA